VNSLAAGLSLALVSAVAVNWAYGKEHDAADDLPPLSPRRPFRSAKLLLAERDWVIGFGAETAGWLLYVAALRLAPLALVQAVSASGIAVLALVSTRGHPSRLTWRERVAVLAALAGLAFLALSLLGTNETGGTPHLIGVVVWLGGCAAGATALSMARLPFARAAVLGLAAGLLFAGGDISVKVLVQGGWWLLAIPLLIGFYALGTLRLQTAFQAGNALTAAGMATLATNAVPIAAGFVLFGESLPAGLRGAAQVAGFAAIVVSAVALGGARGATPDEPAPVAQ
jgi:drug/metabolite transporter (DMT)-like permease